VPRQCVRGPTSGYVSEQACVCPRTTEVRSVACSDSAEATAGVARESGAVPCASARGVVATDLAAHRLLPLEGAVNTATRFSSGA